MYDFARAGLSVEGCVEAVSHALSLRKKKPKQAGKLDEELIFSPYKALRRKGEIQESMTERQRGY